MSNRALESDHALVKSREATEDTASPKGMTIDEIRHQRALLVIQKEFCKAKTLRDLDKLKRYVPFSNGGEKGVGLRTMGSIASRVASGLGYLDYVVLGISAFNAVKKVTGLFRRRKH